jgi:outer membrane protein OmpA-like peptidoglycan-associated protein
VSGVVEEGFDLKRLTSGAVAELHNIVFNTDEFELNGVAQVVVEQFAKYMQMQPKLRVRIEGHTDNVGDAQQNLVLSRKRAESVYAALQNAGISASRLEFKGFGESHPTATNETEEGRAANRRTVFVILE